ncbi:MAG: leucine--tRNA ligase [Bacilli bacterium]|nr:leucine--tRNA ligase [Bacilli bacterium]MDD4795643.1 leucine--tRNA ligase [Bacilli bacterium]
MENINEIEKKWRDKWEEEKIYKFNPHASGEKLYCLEMFSYPSGANLHMGHWWNYGVTDSWARLKRMQGYNVFHPMGFDAFGLPAENYAIKTGIHPEKSTQQNIKTMERQLKNIGATYDWDYEIDTSNPEYYKWSQFLFLEFYKKGLAYKKEAPVNWCPSCNTVLANEQVVSGECERCAEVVVRKKMSQWFFKITDYAEELLRDLDNLDWPERTKNLQRNWIGKSKGAYVVFKVDGTDQSFKVFTTRADTLYGATYCVLAPEHDLVDLITTKEQKNEVLEYQKAASIQSEIDRASTAREKTGVFTGSYAVNPISNKKIPIWIADYVLATYGTGAIMAVPAHDQRDFEFAKKFNLEIIPVVQKITGKTRENETTKKSIVAVVYNPKTSKYLTINWGNLGGRLFIGGTIFENETALECAIREIKEETGYINLKFMHQSFPVNHHYYAFNKDKAYNIDCDLVYFELIDETKIDQDLDSEEENNFKVEWASLKTILDEVKDELHKTAFEFREEKAYIGDGIHINSALINGLNEEDAINEITKYLEKKQIGEGAINYKLRDWLVSRQRYWGAPIPIIYCDKCGMVPVPDADLPVLLPKDAEFTPDGESPLKKSKEFMHVKCPVCGEDAKRECDTLDTFVCSSWYFLRYPDASNKKEAFNKDIINKILPVDKYVGGIEHAVMHLLYARFFTKALRDIGYLNFDEPFKSLVHQGIILGSDGEKMSKSRGNTVTPDPIVDEYGADILRNYLMFGFNYIDGGPWTDDGIIAINKFYNKIERLVKSYQDEIKEIPELEKSLHYTIKNVTEDTTNFQFNTAIARIMEYTNILVKYESKGIPKYYIEQLLLILAPFAPHITEELWCETLKNEFSIHNQKYPKYDETKLISTSISIGVQVNGKLRASISITEDMSDEEIKTLATEEDNVKKHLENKEIVKIIIVPKKIVSIVIK